MKILAHLLQSSGVSAPKFSKFVGNYGYSGAEFMTAIPGTIGGLLSMNAGCYGTEIWEIVNSVQTIDFAGNLHRRTAVLLCKFPAKSIV